MKHNDIWYKIKLFDLNKFKSNQEENEIQTNHSLCACAE